MADSEDNWPKWHHRKGPAKSLHALGVISSNYNIFESALFGLFEHHLEIRGVSAEFSKDVYWGMAENQRSAGITKIFTLHEKDQATIDCVEKLLLYFGWCKDSRNKLVHATINPPIFGGKKDTLYLAKRSGQKAAKINYTALNLQDLRDIADRIYDGSEYCNELKYFLMARDYTDAQLEDVQGVLAYDALPKIPPVPKEIILSEVNHNPPIPPHLRKSSPE
ncbi:MAG TPA: hypothetical protein VFC54_14595 [Pseudolabrys sp.]|nr:hypothetical protein [Pseudolabrys sp.]